MSGEQESVGDGQHAATTTNAWRRRSWTRCSSSTTSSTSTTAASRCCCAKCSPRSLIIALKGAIEELREKIFKNMSQRAAEMMREDLESKGPVRLSEVEAQQKEILQIVRRLADEGQIGWAARARTLMSDALPKERQTAYQRWELASFGDARAEARAAESLQQQHRHRGAAGRGARADRRGARTGAARRPAPKAWRSGYADRHGDRAARRRWKKNTLLQQLTPGLRRRDRACDGDRSRSDLLDLALRPGQGHAQDRARSRSRNWCCPIVREAIGYLPALQQPALLFLHPDDALLVRERMGDELDNAGWRVRRRSRRSSAAAAASRPPATRSTPATSQPLAAHRRVARQGRGMAGMNATGRWDRHGERWRAYLRDCRALLGHRRAAAGVGPRDARRRPGDGSGRPAPGRRQRLHHPAAQRHRGSKPKWSASRTTACS